MSGAPLGRPPLAPVKIPALVPIADMKIGYIYIKRRTDLSPFERGTISGLILRVEDPTGKNRVMVQNIIFPTEENEDAVLDEPTEITPLVLRAQKSEIVDMSHLTGIDSDMPIPTWIWKFGKLAGVPDEMSAVMQKGKAEAPGSPRFADGTAGGRRRRRSTYRIPRSRHLRHRRGSSRRTSRRHHR